MNFPKHRRARVSSARIVLAFGLACAVVPAFATNYDGSLDTSLSPVFNTPFDGIPGLFRYALDLGGSGSDHNADSAAAVAVQTDGKFVVAGFSFNNYSGTDQNACVIQRFNVDGSIDSGFGSAGRVLQNFSPSAGRNDCFLTSVALQGDGKIVVAGNIADASHGERALIERFNADGSFDVSFAGTGYYVELSHKTAFAALKVNPDGPIYAAGRGSGFYGPSYTDNDFYFAAFSATGVLAQELTTYFDLGDDKDDRANAIVFESNFGLPRIYLVGNANSAPYSDQAHHQCAIARYVFSLNDGAFVPDTAFSGDGRTNFDILSITGEGDVYCRAAVARKGGGVIVGGETYFLSPFAVPAGMASYYALGEIDGSGALVTSSIGRFQQGPVPGIFNGIFGMAREAGGKLLVTGYAGTNDANRQPSDGGVIRFNADFSRDTSFGTAGDPGVTILSLDGLGQLLNAHQREWMTALALDNHGRIVLVGERTYLMNNAPGDFDWLVSRLNTSDVIFRDGLDGVVPD